MWPVGNGSLGAARGTVTVMCRTVSSSFCRCVTETVWTPPSTAVGRSIQTSTLKSIQQVVCERESNTYGTQLHTLSHNYRRLIVYIIGRRLLLSLLPLTTLKNAFHDPSPNRTSFGIDFEIYLPFLLWRWRSRSRWWRVRCVVHDKVLSMVVR